MVEGPPRCFWARKSKFRWQLLCKLPPVARDSFRVGVSVLRVDQVGKKVWEKGEFADSWLFDDMDVGCRG